MCSTLKFSIVLVWKKCIFMTWFCQYTQITKCGKINIFVTLWQKLLFCHLSPSHLSACTIIYHLFSYMSGHICIYTVTHRKGDIGKGVTSLETVLHLYDFPLAPDLELKHIFIWTSDKCVHFSKVSFCRVCGPWGLKQIAKQNTAQFSPSQGRLGGSLPGVLKTVSCTLLFGLLTEIKIVAATV